MFFFFYLPIILKYYVCSAPYGVLAAAVLVFDRTRSMLKAGSCEYSKNVLSTFVTHPKYLRTITNSDKFKRLQGCQSTEIMAIHSQYTHIQNFSTTHYK